VVALLAEGDDREGSGEEVLQRVGLEAEHGLTVRGAEAHHHGGLVVDVQVGPDPHVSLAGRVDEAVVQQLAAEHPRDGGVTGAERRLHRVGVAGVVAQGRVQQDPLGARDEQSKTDVVLDAPWSGLHPVLLVGAGAARVRRLLPRYVPSVRPPQTSVAVPARRDARVRP
jgi:hypothetical protein